MYRGRRFSLALALLAGTSLAGCGLPDPDYKGKEHEVDPSQLSQREFLAWHFKKVARNAERGKNYDASYMFYRRARELNPRELDVLLGLGRSLLALNQPLEASEAYGAAIAVDEHNKEAIAGMSKSLDQVASLTRRAPASRLPPLPAVAATETAPAAAPTPEMAGSVDDATAKTPDESAEDQGESSGGKEATSIDAVATAAGDTGSRKVEMKDVLRAVEWAASDKPAKEPMDDGTEVASASDSGAQTMSITTGRPGFKVQLAAYGSSALAEAARSRMAEKDVLAGVQLSVERSPSKAGKSMYRLFTEPFGDRPSAAALCTKLKRRSIGCFLVKTKATTAKWSVKAEPPPAKTASASTQTAPMTTEPEQLPVVTDRKAAEPADTHTEKAKENDSVLRWNNVVTSFKDKDNQKMGAEETAPAPAPEATPAAPPPEAEKTQSPTEQDDYNETTPGESTSYSE